MQILIDIEDEFGDAYTIMAKSNSMSRRQYIADLLRKGAENVPGLMNMVKAQRAGNIQAALNTSLSAKESDEIKDNGGFKDHFHTKKGYRFFYLDEEKGFIDGYGTGPMEALRNGSGREWTVDEYHETFRALPGYVDGEK